MKLSQIIETQLADENHAVVSVKSSDSGYRKSPCADCPWRKDAVGVFPAEAFRLSARTAYDMSERRFGCHSSGTKRSATCAGFLLKGAYHNLAVRLDYIEGRIGDDVHDGGHELHDSYRAMAIANGVDESDPVLQDCRD